MPEIFAVPAEEHVARLNAEGQAADSNRRLQVAQEQVAEFANQREEEASTLLQEVDRALASLQAGGEAGNSSSILTVLQVCLLLLTTPGLFWTIVSSCSGGMMLRVRLCAFPGGLVTCLTAMLCAGPATTAL